MDSIHTAFDEGRRRELGHFLRSRRERLTPADVGLPAGFRRRTPGLRREEVALLSGMGITWYTWLEQGREVRPSVELLASLADALRLDPVERQHLSTLTGCALPEPPRDDFEPVPEPLLRMLDSLTMQPAYVLGRRWDVLAWNRAARALFGDYGRLEGDARNIMHLVFTDAAHRRLLMDWEALARSALAMFRADCARYAGDPDFERLIASLTRASPEFRNWWDQHEVQRPLSGHKRILHPAAGEMSFEYNSLAVSGQPGLKFVVYTPQQADQSAARLETLLRTPALAG